MKQGIINVGINLEYQKQLSEMVSSFDNTISKLQNNMGKIEFSKDLTSQLDALRADLDLVKNDMSNVFKQVGNQKLDISAFEDFQNSISKKFNKIEKEVFSLNNALSSLGDQFQTLNGADVASGIVSQFNDLKKSVSES